MCSMLFFFKQKTAYEMRISDWSSDVCSSDLLGKISLLAAQLAAQHGCGYKADATNAGQGGGQGGFKTLFNTGPDGGQEVYHLHMHVVGGPRPWKIGRASCRERVCQYG